MSSWGTKVIGQNQGHFCKIYYFDCWTPTLWYYYDHQGQGHLKVKVIQESN